MAENLSDFTPSPHGECVSPKLSKKEAASCIKTSRAKRCELSNPLIDKNVWNNAEFDKKYENGEFTKDEKAKRTVWLDKDVMIFRDVNLNFYKVQKGDTVTKIRDKLARFKEFAYLDCLNLYNSLSSFNIQSVDLTDGAWIPIPLPEKQRSFSEKDFLIDCEAAVVELKKDENYGEFIDAILAKVSLEELTATMFAVAKVESGGKPLGQFAFHRYEPGHKQFSYTIFHILNEHAGLRARKNLKLTLGQANHPKNAAKLFLAYLIEKFQKKKDKILLAFPLKENAEYFATYYNGAGWKVDNKGYPDKLRKYYAMAFEPEPIENVDSKPKTKIEIKVEAGLKKIGNATSMMAALEKVDDSKLLKTTGYRLSLGKAILSYLTITFGNSIFQPSDYLAVKEDNKGVFAIFLRNNVRGVIRMPSDFIASR